MYGKALHWWCASHQLNLVIVGSCTVPLIPNMIGTTDQVHVLHDHEMHVYMYVYLRFSNRLLHLCLNSSGSTILQVFIKKVEGFEEGDAARPRRRYKLKELCRTRWVERHDAYEVFIDLYSQVII